MGKAMASSVIYDQDGSAIKWMSNMQTIIDSMHQVKGYEKLGEYRGPFLTLNAGTYSLNINKFITFHIRYRRSSKLYS